MVRVAEWLVLLLFASVLLVMAIGGSDLAAIGYTLILVSIGLWKDVWHS